MKRSSTATSRADPRARAWLDPAALGLHDALSNDAFLDALFDAAVAAAREGQRADVGRLVAMRPELREEIESALELAERVLVRRAPRIPQIRGYVIEREIGRGSMGTVYLAQQQSLGGRRVALKVLTGSAALSRRARERFLAEAAALAKVRHRNVVSVYDVVEETDACAYAMEWVEGCTLSQIMDRLRRSQLASPMEAVAHWLAAGTAPSAALPGSWVAFVCKTGIEIGRALGEVHRAGLVHRDVKPSNILLRSDGTALLSDFGLVRDRESSMHTQSGAFVGTASYAAPEQLRGESDSIDARSDVYSLAALLYEAAGGGLPYGNGSPMEILKRMESSDAPQLRARAPAVPRDLETVIAKAMEFQKSERMASADELADDLERILRLEPVRAKVASPAMRLVKWARRRRSVVSAMAAGLAIAAIGAVLGGSWWAARLDAPRQVRKLRTEAQLELLSPELGERAYAVLTARAATYAPVLTKDAAERALTLYGEALSWNSSDRTLRMEQAAVMCALALTDRWDSESFHYSERQASETELELERRLREELAAPSTAAYFARRIGIPEREAPARSREDVRLRGLTACLAADFPACFEAWSQLDLSTDADPLVDGALGELCLASGEPAKAYPRLLSAFRGFPEAGFLGVDLADAACRVGDTERARGFLAQARVLPRQDRYRSADRVEIDLAAAAARSRAEVEEVYARYEEFISGLHVPTAYFHYASFAQKQGDWMRSLGVLLRVAQRKGLEPLHDRVLDSVENWWLQLSPMERAEFLETSLSGNLPQFVKLTRSLLAFGPSTSPPNLLAQIRRDVRRHFHRRLWGMPGLRSLILLDEAAADRLRGDPRRARLAAALWLTPWPSLGDAWVMCR
ncbi:MAG: serine/threonine protein kinase [Planctomycetes bacterium]|nr:serine/threonine protein kinase [Planctomycetota bacterium]